MVDDVTISEKAYDCATYGTDCTWQSLDSVLAYTVATSALATLSLALIMVTAWLARASRRGMP